MHRARECQKNAGSVRVGGCHGAKSPSNLLLFHRRSLWRLTRSETEFSRPSDNSTLAFLRRRRVGRRRKTGVWRRTRRCPCVHAIRIHEIDSRSRISKLLRLGVDLGQSDTGSADRGGHTCRRHSYVHARIRLKLAAMCFVSPRPIFYPRHLPTPFRVISFDIIQAVTRYHNTTLDSSHRISK